MTTSAGAPPPAAGVATATPRDAKKKYQLTHAIAARPTAMTIQLVVLMAPSRDGIPPVGIICNTPGGYVNRGPRCPLLLAELQHRHRGAADLRHLPVPLLGHLVLHEVGRHAAGEQVVRLRLRLGHGKDGFRLACRFDGITLRLELVFLKLVL